MSAGAPYAQSTKPLPLHNLCYLEITQMAHGRRSLLITSPTRVKSTYWYVICSASTPSCTRYPPSLPSHFPCTRKSSSHSMDCLACFILTVALHLLLMSLCSSSSAITWITLPLPPTFLGPMALLNARLGPSRQHSVPPKNQGNNWKTFWTYSQPQSGPTCLLPGRSSTIGPSSTLVSLQPLSTWNEYVTTCYQRCKHRRPTLRAPWCQRAARGRPGPRCPIMVPCK